MYLADCHVHSNVSADAEVPMTELARLALEAGLNEVCFTDHMEPEVVFGARPDWKHLTAEFEKAQNIMGDQICLHIGVCAYSLSCPTLHNSMDCSPLSSSLHGIFQARITFHFQA